MYGSKRLYSRAEFFPRTSRLRVVPHFSQIERASAREARGNILAREDATRRGAKIVYRTRDICDSTRKIPYWWRSSTEIRVVSLIGTLLLCSKFSRASNNQSETLHASVDLRHQYGIFRVKSQTSLEQGKNWTREERRLFTQVIIITKLSKRKGWSIFTLKTFCV